jgi:hypothetical protein
MSNEPNAGAPPPEGTRKGWLAEPAVVTFTGEVVLPRTTPLSVKEEVEDVTNEPLVGRVTPLIDVTLVGVALKPKVIPVVPPSHVVLELNARLELVSPSA